MPSKAEFYRQMAEHVSTRLVGSWKEWTAFLTTAARLYKYPFHEHMELEVYKSRYGYVCVSFNGSPPDPPYCEGDVCRTPEELFAHLLVEYESFASIQLTKGRREENEDDEEQVRRLCQKYFDRREEAMK